MLKALELCGFKSFADRTRFDFPAGITVVVGPNGSGKSNVVDAVKWVLGSQSAKSLRGQEMVDVIFNGSASRGPTGTAEAILTLDNSDRKLPIDAGEVQVARRVFRSGEAEYLINRQPCRLRDIKELLAGTGITTEAYCIIEQGKVDALLQSSPRERRVIFEEAAGISQFKIKKAAAERRMERVEQNLLRLSDIVDEVENRLRSVRTQAGKARRYRESAARLQELRTQVALVDWRALTGKLGTQEQELANVARAESERETAFAAKSARRGELERVIESAAEGRRSLEAAAAANREQIAARQAALDAQQSRQAELLQETERSRRQLAALHTRSGGISQQLHEAAAELENAETEWTQAAAALHFEEEELLRCRALLDKSRGFHEQNRAEQVDLEREQTQLAGRLTLLVGQQQATVAEQSVASVRLAEFTLRIAELEAAAASQAKAEDSLAEEVDELQRQLAESEQALSLARQELPRVDKQVRRLEARLTRTHERVAVLAELEQRLEGLDGGVRDVLTQLATDAAQRFGRVHGVVADLFHVDVDSAPLIEVALGEKAQFIVVDSTGPLCAALARAPVAAGDRVGFLPLDSPTTSTLLDRIELGEEPGVMGRADRFIETASQFAALARRLLGRTWLVDRLATAVRLSQGAGRGLDFVTGDGELLTTDGTLVVGAKSAVVGILSRRSELRSCEDQIAQLEAQLVEQHVVHTRASDECGRLDSTTQSLRTRLTERTAIIATHRQQTAAARQELEQVLASRVDLDQRLARLQEQCAAVETEVQTVKVRQAEVNERLALIIAEREALEQAFLASQTRSAHQVQLVTEKQVAAARCEERIEMLRVQLTQIECDQQERDRVLEEARQRLAGRETQLAQQEVELLSGRQALAELYLVKERQESELAAAEASAEQLRVQRGENLEQLEVERKRLGAVHAERHKLEATVERLRYERNQLCERLQEDYGIELSQSAIHSDPEATSGKPPLARDAVEREIAELRQQIGQIGAVNVDALDELDEIEGRFGRLSSQYQDLVEAKSALEKIIQRINIDSKQLFVATLETVRGHFQELFRRLFGGGEADIVLEDAGDVLECGIDIIARPPGKEACSISLLSGGEKTLTCVALLLAVFRSKPSPFCVLDEVDAALDEANIGRFVDVLRDFLSFTRFIVVTHSKKTMSGGDTLYGVTMEESGVSKRVAVRFDDVSEDGQIRLAARRAA